MTDRDIFGLKEGWRLAEALPDPGAMIKIGASWYATCPQCGRRLYVFAHNDERAAFECLSCRIIWPTKCNLSTMGHRVLVDSLWAWERRKARQRAEEAA